jgi:hypothetical protein
MALRGAKKLRGSAKWRAAVIRAETQRASPEFQAEERRFLFADSVGTGGLVLVFVGLLVLFKLPSLRNVFDLLCLIGLCASSVIAVPCGFVWLATAPSGQWEDYWRFQKSKGHPVHWLRLSFWPASVGTIVCVTGLAVSAWFGPW